MRVCIIGAGPSGISAARALSDQGVDVEILEARDRIGGRVVCQFSNIDIGASWIEQFDPKINPIAKIVKDLAIQVEYQVTAEELIKCVDTDEQFSAEEIKQARDLCVEILNLEAFDGDDTVFSLYVGPKRHRDDLDSVGDELSVWDQAKIVYEKHFGKGAERSKYDYHHLDSRMKRIKMIVDAMILVDERVEGVSNEFLSLKHRFGMEEIRGPSLRVVDGYGSVFEKICSESGYRIFDQFLSAENVKKDIAEGKKALSFKLNHIVESVEFLDDTVKITSKNGQVTDCDICILAVPQGVIKQKLIKFNPCLPAEIEKAVNAVGSGSLNKVVLRFEKCFWEENSYSVNIFANGDVFSFFNYKSLNGSNTLVMIFGHDRLDWLRKNSDQEIVRFCLEILRKSYPEITECLESFVTRWMDDPFSLGSYSSMVIGSSLDDIRSLSKPLFSNRLYLVGEYTSISSLGYAHGAVISGIKAADHILSQNTK